MGTVNIQLNSRGVMKVVTFARNAHEQVEAARFLERIAPAVEQLDIAAKNGAPEFVRKTD
jgi:hypothetical protein